MKKVYVAPALEIEVYRLDASIASNCEVVVVMGDHGGNVDDGEKYCSDYGEIVGIARIGETADPNAYNVNFWENTCDCYTTAGGPGFFVS